jgi:DNA replication protein DnaC
MSIAYEAKAASGLQELELRVAAEHLDVVCQQAAAGNWSYSHFLGYLLDGELRRRRERTVQLNLQFARFPVLKRLEDFDYAAGPSIDRRLVEELATGRFLCSASDGIGEPAEIRYTYGRTWKVSQCPSVVTLTEPRS